MTIYEHEQRARFNNEFSSVMNFIRQDFPAAKDYNVTAEDEVEILDSQDMVIGKTTTDHLTKYWNKAEGF